MNQNLITALTEELDRSLREFGMFIGIDVLEEISHKLLAIVDDYDNDDADGNDVWDDEFDQLELDLV
jgi:hypothetical protein